MSGFFDESKRAQAQAANRESGWEKQLEDEKARAPQAYRFFTDALLAEIKQAYEAGEDEYSFTYGGSRIFRETEEQFGNGSIIGVDKNLVHAEIERVTGIKPVQAFRGFVVKFR